MKKRMLILFCVCIMPNYVFAAETANDCVVLPTCDFLGYEYESSDCVKLPKLPCPFDASKYYCKKVKSKTCGIGSKYIEIKNENFAGCVVGDSGTYTVVTTNSDNTCGLFEEVTAISEDNNVTTSTGQIIDSTLLETANSKCTALGGVLPTVDELLSAKKQKLIEFENPANLLDVCFLADASGVNGDYTSACVNLAEGVVETLDKKPANRKYSVVCSNRKTCTHGGQYPENNDRLSLSCVPGAFRRSDYDEYCVSDPASATKKELIVSIVDGNYIDIPNNKVQVNYVDLNTSIKSISVSSITRSAIYTACNSLEGGYSPVTAAEMKRLYIKLYKENMINGWIAWNSHSGNVFVSEDAMYWTFSASGVDPYGYTPSGRSPANVNTVGVVCKKTDSYSAQ